MKQNKLVVYTVALGLPFDLKPVEPQRNVDFVCLTDQEYLDPRGWDIRQVEPTLVSDPFRSSREFKICAHRFFAEYDRSLYIDTKVQLDRPAEALWEYLMPNEKFVFGAFKHSIRNSLRKEFRKVTKANLDYPEVIEAQLQHYKIHHWRRLFVRPVWGGVLARRHKSSQCIAAMELWFQHVLRFSRRDQLSLPIALEQIDKGFKNLVRASNHQTPYHTWPVTTMKDQSYRKIAETNHKRIVG